MKNGLIKKNAEIASIVGIGQEGLPELEEHGPITDRGQNPFDDQKKRNNRRNADWSHGSVNS
jgi:hypothetical protein